MNTVPSLSFEQLQCRYEDLAADVASINRCARAVIEAGRPHDFWKPGEVCRCPPCDAWDALKALLEK